MILILFLIILSYMINAIYVDVYLLINDKKFDEFFENDNPYGERGLLR